MPASMESSPGWRWGAAMERANSALFSTMCRERMRDDEELWARVAPTCHLVGNMTKFMNGDYSKEELAHLW